MNLGASGGSELTAHTFIESRTNRPPRFESKLTSAPHNLSHRSKRARRSAAKRRACFNRSHGRDIHGKPVEDRTIVGEEAAAHEPVDLKDSKILITGASGMVARPLVAAYAREARVYALARYGRLEHRKVDPGNGAAPIAADFSKLNSLSAIPNDIDYVINCAVARTNNLERDYTVNADGVGHLMARCCGVEVFLQSQPPGVYEYRGPDPHKESDPLSDIQGRHSSSAKGPSFSTDPSFGKGAPRSQPDQ